MGVGSLWGLWKFVPWLVLASSAEPGARWNLESPVRRATTRRRRAGEPGPCAGRAPRSRPRRSRACPRSRRCARRRRRSRDDLALSDPFSYRWPAKAFAISIGLHKFSVQVQMVWKPVWGSSRKIFRGGQKSGQDHELNHRTHHVIDCPICPLAPAPDPRR